MRFILLFNQVLPKTRECYNIPILGLYKNFYKRKLLNFRKSAKMVEIEKLAKLTKVISQLTQTTQLTQCEQVILNMVGNFGTISEGSNPSGETN